MDNRTIEEFAANAVKEKILDIDILHPNISVNDKTLSWDGSVEVYKSENKVKANLDGTVDVQVKGTLSNNHSKTISFPVETADLRNYLNNGGVIYFVVRIHKERTSERKVYYVSLTQVKIKQYLDGVKKQKTKSIKLEEFPSDKYERASIIINFLQSSRRQASYVESGFISLEEIHQKEYNYTIPISGYGKKDTNPLYSAILGREAYAYVIAKENNALIPVDTPLTIQEVKQKVDEIIKVGDQCYYDSYERIISTEGTSIKIGESISLSFGKFKATTVRININLPPLLRKAARDMQFIIDALNAKKFSIGEIELGLDNLDVDTADFISNTEKRLKLFKNIIKLFTILNVDEDLDVNKLTNREQRDLDLLIKAIVKKEELRDISDEIQTSVLDLKISNLLLKLIIKNNEDDTHSIQDFFNSEVAVLYKDMEGNQLEASPYSALPKEEWSNISNINYSAILESYKKVAQNNPNIFERANADMLQMLLAYDETKNAKLLSVIKDIAQWILTDGGMIRKNIATINYLQGIKRERDLNKDENRQLCEITEDNNASIDEKVGAYLLLDNQVSAEINFEKLPEKEQVLFRLYPIFKFWDNE